MPNKYNTDKTDRNDKSYSPYKYETNNKYTNNYINSSTSIQPIPNTLNNYDKSDTNSVKSYINNLY